MNQELKCQTSNPFHLRWTSILIMKTLIHCEWLQCHQSLRCINNKLIKVTQQKSKSAYQPIAEIVEAYSNNWWNSFSCSRCRSSFWKLDIAIIEIKIKPLIIYNMLTSYQTFCKYDFKRVLRKQIQVRVLSKFASPSPPLF